MAVVVVVIVVVVVRSRKREAVVLIAALVKVTKVLDFKKPQKRCQMQELLSSHCEFARDLSTGRIPHFPIL